MYILILSQKMVYVVPLNDVHQMNIMWPIPDYIPDYTAQVSYSFEVD